ncbi:MAG: sn-glycerol-3-phosphate import ATP-binding protein UgpC [Betaproteobacteria bacterium]|nr:sn-glycerol-3-phosphate import ATP-binding protein UgpC [Betaproteobacteria bacterium]
MAKVELRNVYKSYGTTEIIHGVSMDIADGEFVVMVGPSGCGKSTLLRMIAGLEEISGGDIAIDGRVVNNLEPKDRDIAMVFQQYALYPHMSVHDNMAYGLKIRGLPKAEIETRVQRAAEILELSKLLGRRPRELSGGQRQRVAMGRAIVREPKVFLFDEPLSNLDAKLRVQMRAELQALHKRLGTTTVFVTHDQVEAMTLAQRMMVMNAGHAEQIGAPLEVYGRPASTFVAGFIGSPPMNLIPGTLAEGGAVLLADAGARVGLPAALPKFDGRKLLLGVRPEHLEPCDEAAALLVPDVDFIELLGSDVLVYGHLGADRKGARVAARLHGSMAASDGHLALRFTPKHMHLFDAETGKRIEIE